MKRLYKIYAVMTSIILIACCTVGMCASLTVNTNFRIITSPSFRIPLYEVVDSSESGELLDVARCHYRMTGFTLEGVYTFTSEEGAYHYNTGTVNANLQLTSDANSTYLKDQKMTFHPIVSENLVTGYNQNQYGLNTDRMRITMFFANYFTYGSSIQIPLGEIDIDIYTEVPSAVQPVSYLTITPTLTSVSGSVLYSPNSPDSGTGITAYIYKALQDARLTDVYVILNSILSQDASMFGRIISNQEIAYTMLGYINSRLVEMSAQDYNFYQQVIEYLEANQTEASEAIQEATRVQEEASQIASELSQTEPDIDGALESAAEWMQAVGGEGRNLFFYLREGSVLLVLCIFAFSMATIAYILYGKRG